MVHLPNGARASLGGGVRPASSIEGDGSSPESAHHRTRHPFRIKLRSDVKFHDGSKMTAEDVAYSIQRIIDPKFASPQLGQFDQIVKAEATGPNVVTLTTKSPYPALLAQLVKLSIVPKKIVEEVGKDAFNLKPVGSGPYKFDAWQRGVSWNVA